MTDRWDIRAGTVLLCDADGTLFPSEEPAYAASAGVTNRLLAGEQLGISPEQGIAVEDTVNGALSAVAAGYRTAGLVAFVPAPQRASRTAALRDAGVTTVVRSWADVADLLLT
jgi:hypothetical protein